MTPEVNARLDSYFHRYCDYIGNMAPGFVAWHNYDFAYRHRLSITEDAELKRLYVLSHLYREVDRAIRELEKGSVNLGKNEFRDMTPAEEAAARARIAQGIEDLAQFDPGDPTGEIGRFSERLQQVKTNSNTKQSS